MIIALTSASSTSTPPWKPPSSGDAAAIQAVIEARWAALGQVLPTRDALGDTVPRADYAKAQANYLAGMRAVGTKEYADQAASLSMAAGFRGDRNIGVVVTKLETRVLSMEYKGTLPHGDIVVWARLWNGEVDLHFASGKVGVGPATTTRVDDTPTYQYVLRKVDGRWRIASEACVYESEDMSGAYGPDTAHWVDPHPQTAVPAGAVPAGASTPIRRHRLHPRAQLRTS